MRTTASLLLLSIPFVMHAQHSAEDHLHLAQRAYESGKMADAEMHADSAIILDATLPAAFKLRGDIRQHEKNLDGAYLDYAEAQKLDPNDPRLYVSRAAARITDGNLKGAIKDLDRAQELDPNDPDIYYNRACAEYMGQDNSAALRDADRAVKLKKDHADALYLRGVVKGEEYKEEDGMKDIDEALRLKPEIPGAMMSMAVLLYEMKRYEEAIDKFAVVIATDTIAEDVTQAYYYSGDCWYNKENKEKACADWAMASQRGDKDAVFIKKNYCNTDATKIPKKPARKRRKSVVQF